MTETLTSFKQISDLHVFHRLPVTKSRKRSEIPGSMEAFMTSIFESDEPPMAFDLSYIRTIAPFSLEELQVSLKQMSRGRCKDKTGIRWK